MASLTIQNLEQRFNNFVRTSNFDQSVTEIQTLFEKNLVANTSKFGNAIGQIEGGFQSLTQSLDDVVINLDISVPTQSTGNIDIVQLTADVPNIKDKLVKKLEDAASDLNSITGGTLQDGFLDVNITTGIPEAIGKALSDVGATPGDIKNVVGKLQDLEDGFFEKIETSAEDILNDILGPIVNLSNNIENLKNQVFGDITNLANNILGEIDQGFPSMIQNVTEQITGNGKNTLKGLVNKYSDIPLDPYKQSLALKYVGEGNLEQAAGILQTEIPNVSVNEIISEISTIDLRVSSNLFTTPSGGISTKLFKLDDYAKNFDGENTVVSNVASTSSRGHKFTFVSTHEELEVELKGVNREITEVIVHWTESYLNQDIGSEELQASSGNIPYHYLIRKDGSLQRGRPVDTAGGALNNGHEQYSIQIAFVAGINAPTGVTNIDQFLSAESITRRQMDTLQVFLGKAYGAWPGLQVMGHNDIDTTQFDPGFNVVSFTENFFGKSILLTDPSSQGPLSRDELIKTKAQY